MTRNVLRRFTAAALALCALAVAAAAQEQQQNQPVFSISNVRIKNFGQMDERFFRGAEPKQAEDFEALKALGINTVIDLQAEAEPAERGMVEAAGMRYVHIPMIAKKYPTEEAVAAFLKAVDDPETGKFFVHCAGGRHRTGVMGAVYRYTKYGWDFDQVYREMKQFDFYTRWGHGDFKKFVEDYWGRVQSGEVRVAAGATHAAAATSAQQK
ncbi:MAG TPA: tyrosine-protein phosphatase [Pyrinomonadaceae bacterium]|nr:tyrosine-protein phosphatase [Pyrinomonadaceae bacterium]